MNDYIAGCMSGVLGVLAVALLIIIPTAITIRDGIWERDAVARQHAEYYRDGNQTKWRWKPTEQVK